MKYGNLKDLYEYSGHPFYAGTEVTWIQEDSEEMYKAAHRRKKIRNQLIHHGWATPTFTYKFNEYGFRTQSFKPELENKNIMFLGCSHTSGVGLPIEDAFPSVVAKKLNIEHYNLGSGGASLDTCFRYAYCWIQKLKPKVLVVAKPYHQRFELNFDPNPVYRFTRVLPESVPPPLRGFYRTWTASDLNSHFQCLKNMLAIEHICRLNGVQLIQFDISKTIRDIDDKKLASNLGRDLAHCGKDYHEIIAERTLKLIDKQWHR